MRRLRIAFLAALVFVFIACLTAQAESDPASIGIMRFPLSLKSIEASAFEKTAAETVYFEGNLTLIGDYAFADSPNLTSVYIPPSVTAIGEGAFTRTDRLTLYGVPGSEADKWAAKHDIPFKAVDIWAVAKDGLRALSTSGRSLVSPGDVDLKPSGTLYTALPAAPKERPEMYPIDYDFP